MLAVVIALQQAVACEAPDLSPAQIESYFEQSDLLNSAEWDYFHQTTDCPVHGEVAFHGKRWSFRLYQTGFGELGSEELGIVLRFVCQSCEVEGIERVVMDLPGESD